jgi:DNA-directed RNA polymerase subunit RPC12/RpoP
MSTKNTWRQWSGDDPELPSIEKFKRHDHTAHDPEGAQSDPEDTPRQDRSRLENPSFRCCHCKTWVESDPERSGVKHRNHCPYCLFSRHVDAEKPGDRRSTCGAAMQPIGLTLKHTYNKYASDDGELMLIHRCLNCGKLSINRIAADDNAEQLISIFEASAGPGAELLVEIARQGIRPLGPDDLNIVLTRLYGACHIEITGKIPAAKERANV